MRPALHVTLAKLFATFMTSVLVQRTKEPAKESLSRRERELSVNLF